MADAREIACIWVYNCPVCAGLPRHELLKKSSKNSDDIEWNRRNLFSVRAPYGKNSDSPNFTRPKNVVTRLFTSSRLAFYRQTRCTSYNLVRCCRCHRHNLPSTQKFATVHIFLRKIASFCVARTRHCPLDPFAETQRPLPRPAVGPFP